MSGGRCPGSSYRNVLPGPGPATPAGLSGSNAVTRPRQPLHLRAVRLRFPLSVAQGQWSSWRPAKSKVPTKGPFTEAPASPCTRWSQGLHRVRPFPDFDLPLGQGPDPRPDGLGCELGRGGGCRRHIRAHTRRPELIGANHPSWRQLCPTPGTKPLSGAAVPSNPTHEHPLVSPHPARAAQNMSETFHLPFLSGDAWESPSVWASDGLERRL